MQYNVSIKQCGARMCAYNLETIPMKSLFQNWFKTNLFITLFRTSFRVPTVYAKVASFRAGVSVCKIFSQVVSWYQHYVRLWEWIPLSKSPILDVCLFCQVNDICEALQFFGLSIAEEDACPNGWEFVLQVPRNYSSLVFYHSGVLTLRVLVAII